MVDKLKIKKGDRVLITGASGGMGVMTVQYARHAVGEEGLVVATCGPSKIEAVTKLGPHEVLF
jgi:NADPH:quinone reductase-like Zn-dependent oxidoreductase